MNDDRTGLRDPELWSSIEAVFRLEGKPVRVHRTGRMVLQLDIEGDRHFLKRYWQEPSDWRLRNVRLGENELRMIDWFRERGYAVAEVVAQGRERVGLLTRRLFFLMREVPGERVLDAAWKDAGEEAPALLRAVAERLAMLHDQRCFLRDAHARHFLIGGEPGAPSIRHIDLERAGSYRAGDFATLARLAARDVEAIIRSADTPDFSQALRADFLGHYRALRPRIDLSSISG